MAELRFIIPDALHDKLRMAKIKQKKNIPDIIMDYVKQGLKK